MELRFRQRQDARWTHREVPRKEGDTWVLRYRVTDAEGRRVENSLPVGHVRDFPNEKSAWREVDKLGLCSRVNEAPALLRIRFAQLAEHYLRADFGQNAVRPKSEDTELNMNHIVRDYLIPRFGPEITEDIKPLDIQRWMKSLHRDRGLAWTTVSKIRGVMLRAYKTGILHELVSKNPCQPIETRKTDYRAIMLTPDQTHAILRALSNPLHRILVLTCAATALRASELVAIHWADLRWAEGRIRVSKRWLRGKDGATKTESSDGYVPLHPRLARHLEAWRIRTPYGRETDFVFPSLKMSGKVPVSAGVFVADHLRSAAKNSGVRIPEGHRFGLHNLRHSLSNWMVNKAKVEPKTVQGILRHSRIQTTLDLYTQEDSEETRAAQGNYLRTFGTQRRKAS
jgi:integrase